MLPSCTKRTPFPKVKVGPGSGNKIPAATRLQANTEKIANPGTRLPVISAIAPTVGGAMKPKIPSAVRIVANINETLSGLFGYNSIGIVARTGKKNQQANPNAATAT